MKRRTRNFCRALALACIFLTVVFAVFHAGDWRARRPDTLELSLSDNPTTLDPALIKDVAGGRLAALLYPNLVRYGRDENLTGDLAASWDVSPDGLVYTFHLRPDMRFADGRPITARDVRESFHRSLCPDVASPRAWVLMGIEGAAAFHEGRAETIDGITMESDAVLRLALERPSGTFLSLLTMPSAAVLPAQTPRKPMWGVDNLPTCGGPYRISLLEPDIALALEANPFYYGPSATVPRIRYRIIRNPFAAVSEFRQGRLDIIEIPDAFDRFFLNDPRWAPYVDSVEGQNTFYLGFNCTRPPFDNRDFRRAICRSIDRQAVIDAILHGKATAAVGPIPPGLSGYDPHLAGLSYDLASARGILSGPANPQRPLGLLVLSNSDSIVVAQALAGQLAAAGLQIEVAPRERATFKALLRDGDFDMVYYSWVADYPDGENFLVPLFATSPERSGGNYTAYSNFRVDGLLARAAASNDALARAELYREVSTIVVEDAPRAFLWHSRRVTVRQPWISGFRPPRIFNAERFEGVRIDRAD